MEKYLIHYGVQGQKWGKRNYQYEDGSLTPEGRIHYGVGATRYSRRKTRNLIKYRADQARKYVREENNKNAREIRRLESAAERIANKYDLDRDDGGGGDTRNYSERELRDASRKYLDLLLEAEDLGDMAEDMGWERATKDMVAKYGDKSVDYVNRYNSENAALAVAAVMAIYGGSVLLLTKV